MKIIIIGAGEVGLHLARSLSWEEHKVVVIDQNQNLVDRVSGSLDVMAIHGSGTSASTLDRAGVKSTDLLIAVTSVDEVNIVACMLAKQFGVNKCIARIRREEYSEVESPVSLVELGIDQVINPELEAAREVVSMVKFQQTVDMVECAGGKMFIVGIKVEPDAKILNKPLRVLTPAFPDAAFRLVAIVHNNNTIIPTGNNIISKDDIVYVITAREDLEKVFELTGKPDKVSREIMLLGGSMIGRYVAQELEKDKENHLKMIECDSRLSKIAAEQLVNTIVVQGGDSTEIDLMTIEGISEMGVFAALTEDDENNIVTSLFARQMNVKRIITLVSKPEYLTILHAIGLEAAVNERLLTSGAILKYLRGGKIMAVSSLHGIEAEIIEFTVDKWAKAADKRLRDIKFPPGALVGAIDHGGEVTVAVGDSLIRSDDRVVVFCLQKAIPKLEKLFQ